MPPLTTVHQPSYELGFQAAQATLQAAQHEKPVEPVQTVLPTRLVVRQSEDEPEGGVFQALIAAGNQPDLVVTSLGPALGQMASDDA
jgi:hypothetical protein